MLRTRRELLEFALGLPCAAPIPQQTLEKWLKGFITISEPDFIRSIELITI